jgi:hypothetical protein
MMARPVWWAVADSQLDEVAVVNEKGRTSLLDVATLAEDAARERARIMTVQQGLLRSLVVEAHNADPEATSAALAGSPSGLRLASVVWRGAKGWRAEDPSGLYPASFGAIADALGLDAPELGDADAADVAEDAAHALALLHDAWCGVVENVAGVRPRNTIAGTAAAAAIPPRWHRWALSQGRSELWTSVRRAYYGGRVQWWQERTPLEDEDVTVYDVHSLYGSVMLGELPDPKLYEGTTAGGRVPHWLDVTVTVQGDPGPLPRRNEARAWSLDWPTFGTWRGWYAQPDLEREGVRIDKVHRIVSGRWSMDLAEPVGRWLDLRSSTSCTATAKLCKLLVNTLAGKLCQRPMRWKLVSARVAPEGAQPIHPDFPLFAVPDTDAAYQPFAAPAVGSWVTSAARAVVWPELVRGAHYTDTDSVHRASSAPPPLNMGDAPGQWAVEAQGSHRYTAVKRYRVGDRVAGVRRKLMSHEIR